MFSKKMFWVASLFDVVAITVFGILLSMLATNKFPDVSFLEAITLAMIASGYLNLRAIDVMNGTNIKLFRLPLFAKPHQKFVRIIMLVEMLILIEVVGAGYLFLTEGFASVVYISAVATLAIALFVSVRVWHLKAIRVVNNFQ